MDQTTEQQEGFGQVLEILPEVCRQNMFRRAHARYAKCHENNKIASLKQFVHLLSLNHTVCSDFGCIAEVIIDVLPGRSGTHVDQCCGDLSGATIGSLELWFSIILRHCHTLVCASSGFKPSSIKN